MSYIYKHVVIAGIDGMGNFNKDAFTPHMDKIFKSGAEAFYAVSLSPTISAQNWGAMLLGAQPEVHGLTNSIVGQEEYTNTDLPSFFKTVRDAFPDAFLCSCCNWNPINHGIIEHSLDVEMHTADNDEKLTEIIEECVSRKPRLLFIQFDDVDGAGHHYGYGTKGHLDSITAADGCVGRVYDAYKKAEIIEDTLFIVVADHGGYDHGHGGYTDGEKYVYLALAGKTVLNADIPYAQTKDISAIVLHAFGLDVPQYDIFGYSSQIPLNIFDDAEPVYNRPAEIENYSIESRDTPEINSAEGLYSFFEKDSIKLALFFDNNTNDSSDNCVFTQNGQVKYYSNGVRGAYGELGATGTIACDSLKFGEESFSIAVWLKIDKALNRVCFICGGKDMTGQGAGFALGFDKCDSVLFIENGEPDSRAEINMPYHYDIASGWLHIVYSVDRKNGTVEIYHNFELKKRAVIPGRFKDVSFDCLPFTVGDDASGKCNSEKGYIFNLDDLIVFNKALCRDDIAKLSEYYGIQ
ncbi:MAG: alkaline phosphatase family protein [Clostridia bacterium]|nr:alkaline phosphatase family protein [Clostridia bacterium]